MLNVMRTGGRGERAAGMTRRNVLLDSEPPPPGETERFVEIPKGNDRMWTIKLHNRGRVRRGTATAWRWRAIVEGVKNLTVYQPTRGKKRKYQPRRAVGLP